MINKLSNDNRRILLIDDNIDLHEHFRQVLTPARKADALATMASSVLGDEHTGAALPGFEVTSAYQGREGMKEVVDACRTGAPFALVFVDMRMPPGWDGLETLDRIWAEDSEVQAVLCTAYTDHAWSAISARLQYADRLLVLKKPFAPLELRQMASALTKKWNEERAQRTREQHDRALLAAIPDRLLRIERDGRLWDASAGAHAGQTSAGATLPADLRERLLDAARLATGNQEVQVIRSQEHSPGGSRCTEVRVVPLGGDNALAILRDITDQSTTGAASLCSRISTEPATEGLPAVAAPLIPIRQDVLMMPLFGPLDIDAIARACQSLTEGVRLRRPRAVILDLSGVPSMRREVANTLACAIHAIHAPGLEIAVAGLHDAVAHTLASADHSPFPANMYQHMEAAIRDVIMNNQR